jgi:hypothetical protein
MKTVHSGFLLILSMVSALGQGQILFQNNSATAVTNVVLGQKASASTMVGLYVNANTAATSSSPGWSLQATTNLITGGGLFFGGIRTTTFPAGVPVAVQVRAWLLSASYASYEEAIAAVAAGQVALRLGDGFGTSVIMNLTPTPSSSPTVNLVSSGLQPIIIGIPEPSVTAFVLCALFGGGIAMLFRRRRS